MALTVFDVMLAAHEGVGTISYGVSSAGTTLTLNDRTESSAFADDTFNGGTLFFIESTKLSIQGQTRRVTDYNATSGQFTFTTVLSSAVTANTKYAVATPEFNYTLMERLVNSALRSVGPLVYTDRTMQSSANQRVYAMSTLAGRGKPFRVDIMGRTGSSADDPQWVKLHGWYIQPSTVGAGQAIVFPRDLPANRDIRILYEADHPAVSASTQIIDDRLHPELVTTMLIEKMYSFRNSRSRGAQEFDVQRWSDAKRQSAEARIRWPVYRPKRAPDVLVIGDGDGDVGVRAPPYGPLA